MNLHIVGMGLSQDLGAEETSRLSSDPSFRKATRGMMMGYAALMPLLKILDKKVSLEKVGFVLGSSSGELLVTTEFLKTLDTQGIARPLLFQNSLHNATLGFLALKIGLTGPTVCVSNRYFTAERSLEMASVLLESSAEFCIVLTVESKVPEIEEAQRLNYPAGLALGEGAGAILLTRAENAKAYALKTLAVIDSVECLNGPAAFAQGETFYDSNGIENLVLGLRKNSQVLGTLELSKPDGSFSVMKLSSI
jgi:Beta-ketoacyl synthase, N-terminal domain